MADRHPSVTEFYDGLADDYHLVYGDCWDDAVARQGAALQRIIRDRSPNARDVLDCSCGIGTQAISLALRGYRVIGSDISQRSVARAEAEAQRLGAAARFTTADFRDLSNIPGAFDVVLSCDNAIPHLLDATEIDRALSSMWSRLRPGGLLVISTRDYDRALAQRPRAAPPIEIPGPPRRILLRLHEWDAPDSRLYTVRLLILTERPDGWTVADHSSRYRAVTAAELSEAATRAGFADPARLTADEAAFHQPVMIATRPADAEADRSPR